jgi:hypothetical protein
LQAPTAGPSLRKAAGSNPARSTTTTEQHNSHPETQTKILVEDATRQFQIVIIHNPD